MVNIKKINNESYEKNHSHAMCGESILTPNANKTDCNRLQMFTNNIMQCVQTVGNEPPYVFSGFENQVGKYSTGYKFIKGEWKILKRIYKNKYNYILIIQNNETKEYDILYRKTAEWLTEHFGYKNKNGVIDRLKEGDMIDNIVISRNLNYDNVMNFQYGVNLNALYIPFAGYTNEDAIVISESTAEKMSSFFVKKIEVNVNTNDILCNIYGDDDFYKTFPDIGEDIKDSILIARRRINYSNNIYNLKDLSVIKDDDDITYFKGKIIDIDIFSNCPIEKMKDQQYNKQVYSYLIKLKKYYKEIIDFLGKIREEDKECIFSDDLMAEYNRCLQLSDPEAVLDSDGRIFDNYVIKFTIMYKKPLIYGSKLTGRYGRNNLIMFLGIIFYILTKRGEYNYK